VGRRLGMDQYLAAVVFFWNQLFQNFAESAELLTLRQTGNKINQKRYGRY
jgi:small basic protein